MTSMTSINLMDIFNKESSLSDKILCDNNDATITVCINNTCTMFNKMTMEDIDKHREEYYKLLLPKKIEETIENKMLAILKNPKNICVYKEPEEYDADLEKLASQINENSRESILAKMIGEFKHYVSEYYLCDSNSNGIYNMYSILMKEFYKFIKNHLKHEITNEDFEEGEEEIRDIIINNNEGLM